MSRNPTIPTPPLILELIWIASTKPALADITTRLRAVSGPRPMDYVLDIGHHLVSGYNARALTHHSSAENPDAGVPGVLDHPVRGRGRRSSEESFFDWATLDTDRRGGRRVEHNTRRSIQTAVARRAGWQLRAARAHSLREHAC